MSPNYEIVFFSSDIFEVVNILDFFDGKEVKLHETLKKFKVEGEWHNKYKTHICILFEYVV